MDYIYLSIICAIAGTLPLILVYGYLYIMYRERYMVTWIIGWLAYSLRLGFFDSGIIHWKESVLVFSIYHILSISTILLFLWSNQLLINKPINRRSLYAATATFVLSIVFTLLRLPILDSMIPLACFAGIILIYIGRTFIHNIQIQGIGNRITGYAFILWGILTIGMPYTLTISWMIPWYYLLGGVLRLFIASGTIMVYLEKTRMALAIKETQYRLLTENSADIIFHYNLPDNRYEFISPSVLPVTGYPSEEYYENANLLINLIHPNDLPLFDTFLRTPSSTTNLPHSFRLIHRNKSIVWIEPKYVPIYDKAGNLITRVGILRDVTARKNLEEIAAHAETRNMVGEMAAKVAHEIRNPLTTVHGYLQMMAKNQELANYRPRFNIMINELDRTNMIISEYLLLATDKQVDLKKCCLNTINTTTIFK